MVTNSGDVYYALYLPDGSGTHWTFKGTIPTTSPIVTIQSGEDTYAHAFAADGSFFVSDDLGTTWVLKGNVFASSTPALKESWGALKTRYR